jgi:hypothetical protein
MESVGSRTVGSGRQHIVWFHVCCDCGHEDESCDQHPRIEYEEDYPPVEF